MHVWRIETRGSPQQFHVVWKLDQRKMNILHLTRITFIFFMLLGVYGTVLRGRQNQVDNWMPSLIIKIIKAFFLFLNANNSKLGSNF